MQGCGMMNINNQTTGRGGKAMKKVLLFVLAILLVTVFTSVSFAALTVTSTDQDKLKVQTLGTTNLIADQGLIVCFVVKGNGLGGDAVWSKRQALFKQKSNTGRLMIVSFKRVQVRDTITRSVVRPDNSFTFISMGLYYYLVTPADQHRAIITQEASILTSGNQMKKPTGLDNGFFL